MRFEKVVTSGQLKGHASCGPNVGRRTISGAKKDFQTPILSCLNIFREVMVLQNIGKLNLYTIEEQAPKATVGKFENFPTLHILREIDYIQDYIIFDTCTI